ncbi:vitamin K epoxide reductase family protein [Ktedonosporobacter rubrisoli]|nr:vitamin K epoxide reductase family protein [Ktedonosporobacter rubrisoli]
MTYTRQAVGQIALLILALVGIGISIYLTIVHYNAAPLVCSTSGLVDCENVLSSPYSVVPGTQIPISVPGLFWFVVYAALSFGAWRLWPGKRELRIAELVWSALGMLTVFYLVYAEIVRIGKICAWCTGVHVIILLTLLIAVFLLQEAPADEEYDVEEEPSSVTALHD